MTSLQQVRARFARDQGLPFFPLARVVVLLSLASGACHDSDRRKPTRW